MNEVLIPRIGNAAGTCNRPEQFEKLLCSACDIITVGPISVKPRPGNLGDNAYWDQYIGTVNSKGLPGYGIPGYRDSLPAMIQTASDAGKTLAATVPLIDHGDAETLAEFCAELRIPIVEINVGCNHVFVDGVQKIPLSYYPEELKRVLSIFRSIAGQVCDLRVKLSPYLPIVPLEIGGVLRPFDIAVVSCNTAGNAYMFREDFRPAIEFGKHLGGYGGKGMKPIALGQIVQLRAMLPNHHIIGVSGIENGRDMWEFIKVGANEIQIGSAWYFTEDPRVFGDVISQYVDILEEHPL